MRRSIFMLAVLAGLCAGPSRAAPSEADRTAIQAVIRQQLDAFQADDATRAFALASPGIRRQFGDPETFLALVRQGYPMVYRPRETHFGALDEEDGRIVQKVAFVGPDGVLVTALYMMEREPDGSWRIAGCVIARAPSESA
ncbi:MAG TPA: DUF4864 domain-containing protein [Aliidongia sp.]|uniref:DUF4864 domain-containing protein n=1 Tax=Aliidongia sp. TaxID=1914230 RepID=UPI002DDC92B7|nr:DUF4864 domain-containing protein [Aliidongia sp.]HEV2677903.1 DUF4864 domain-containing protein [Aliidongia sp.]